jgi:hypothetical protein
LTTCFYPHRSIKRTEEILSEEILLPYTDAGLPVRDCVLEKLINAIARDRWTLLQAETSGLGFRTSGSSHYYTLYFQRNA